MGVGMGQALAGALVNPGGCVAVFGDSAFGFSGMVFSEHQRLYDLIVAYSKHGDRT